MWTILSFLMSFFLKQIYDKMVVGSSFFFALDFVSVTLRADTEYDPISNSEQYLTANSSNCVFSLEPANAAGSNRRHHDIMS